MKKILLTLVMMLGIFMLVGCGKETVNLNDYITIETSGFNSLGTAKCTFDYQKFNQDFGRDIKYNSKYKKEAQKLFGTEKPLSKVLLNECDEPKLSKTAELYNGDKIVLKWTFDEELLEKYFNCDLVYEDITYEVTDLKKLEKKDVFEYYDVEFEGCVPYVKSQLRKLKNYEGENDITVYVDHHESLYEGDTVYVHLKLNCSEEEFAQKYGYLPTAEKRMFIAKNLEHYARSVSEIPKELLEELDANSRLIFQKQIDDFWVKPENLISMELTDKYLVYFNRDTSVSNMNYLSLVYKINATHPKTGELVKYYYYVEYGNVLINEDGTAVVERDTVFNPGEGWYYRTFKVDGYVYCGYETLGEFEENIIKPYLYDNVYAYDRKVSTSID